MSTVRKLILLAEASVGDHLTWEKPVAVDPQHTVMAPFRGTLVEPPIEHMGSVLLTVAGPGGWRSDYELPSSTTGFVTLETVAACLDCGATPCGYPNECSTTGFVTVTS